MKFREIANRLNGFSTPIFGVSWTPAQLDIDVARRVLVFLEDRGVLYEPYSVEIPGACVESVREIRQMLTTSLADGGLGDQLEADIRTLRGASTEFLRKVEGLMAGNGRDGWEDRQLQDWLFEGDARSWVFNQTLGAYRAEAGMDVAKLAVEFGIDVDEPLESALPSPPV